MFFIHSRISEIVLYIFHFETVFIENCQQIIKETSLYVTLLPFEKKIQIKIRYNRFDGGAIDRHICLIGKRSFDIWKEII